MKVISKKSLATEGKYAAIAKAAHVTSPRGGMRDIIESDDDDTGPGPG
jgi:hypothetical protein